MPGFEFGGVVVGFSLLCVVGQGGGGLLLFRSAARLRAFGRLFAALRAEWLSRVFGRGACICRAASRWGVPPCRVAI